MSHELAIAMGLGLLGLLVFTAVDGAAEGQVDSPAGKPSVVQERTADGTAYAMLSPPAKGPAPTLLLFATTAETTLTTEPYRRAGTALHRQGWNVVSLDLPCHGAQLREGEPAQLDGWAARTARGEDIAADLCGRTSKVLDHLVKNGLADPERVAVAGTSRGGFMAFHVAAADARVRAAVGFAPVTDLLRLTEFAALKDNALARRLALNNVADKLADRAAWITIGDRDQRVGTDSAKALAEALTQAAKRKGVTANVKLQVLPVPGHNSLPAWYDQAAAWLLALPALAPATVPAAGAAPADTGQSQSRQASAPAASSRPSQEWLPEVKGFPRMKIEQRTDKPLFACQEKWEAGIISFLSVVRDKESWHLWYETFDTAPGHDLKRLLCYAHSRDGVRWERPNLGLVEYNGGKSNNVIRDGRASAVAELAGTQVFLDEQAPAKERFKMVFIRSGTGGYPIHGATSPDGLKWQEIREPLITGNFDTQNVCFRDGNIYRL